MSVVDQLEVAVPEGEALGQSVSKPKRRIWDLELTPKRVPRKELMHFSRQLAVFIRAGIPILDALQVIVSEMGGKKLREVLQDVIARLEAGSTFSEAMTEHASALPPYYCGILRSAELTGRLDTVLIQLSEYVERDVEARRKVTSALAYPMVILGTGVIVVAILVVFVLPKFESFFQSLHATLPLPTRMLLHGTHFLTHNLLGIGLTLLALVVVPLLVARTVRGRAAKDAAVLKIWVIGDLIRHVALERFCRILAAMMTAGVPLPEAMSVTAGSISNVRFRQGLLEARERMMQGEGLAGPLVQTKLFPPSANQMLTVGENTGTLDEQLETAAVYFERELDYKIKRFTTLFEPAVLMFVGLGVGFVAVAMVSAMYGIFHQVKVH